MSKVFEALEHARREMEVRRPVEPPSQASITPPEEPAAAPSATALAPVGPELNLEREMTALYQSITSLLPDVSHKAIQFISSRPGEGTSTIVRELAKVISASMGRSVLLLDINHSSANRRTFFDYALPPELHEVIKGTQPIDQAIRTVEDTGLVSPLFYHSILNPQKIAPQLVDDLWDQLRQRFEWVLIDSPSVSASSSGLAVVGKADGVVFVLEAERTRWPVAQAAREKIVTHGGNILGMVFNKRRFYIPEFVYGKI